MPLTNVTFNLNKLLDNLGNSKSVKTAVAGIAKDRVKQKQEVLVEEFNSHKITQEIDRGPEASNSSGTLGYGNLFSFIGFERDDHPTFIVREILQEDFPVRKVQHIKGSKFRVSLSRVDSLKDRIFDATPIPWLSGRSWIDGVEKGLAGFGSYLYDNSGRLSKRSRSTTAIQTKSKIRGGSLSGSKYVSDMIKRFQRSIANL